MWGHVALGTGALCPPLACINFLHDFKAYIGIVTLLRYSLIHVDVHLQIAAAEVWPHLSAGLLPKLVALQKLVSHVMLPYTCVKYLALPVDACDEEDRCGARA